MTYPSFRVRLLSWWTLSGLCRIERSPPPHILVCMALWSMLHLASCDT